MLEKQLSDISKDEVEFELLRRQIEERCKNDLFFLCDKILRNQNDPNQLPLCPFHQQLCDYVSADFKKFLILCPRGHLKSSIITVGWTIQQILKDRNLRVLVTNATLENAKKFLREIKEHFERNEMLRLIFGDLTTKKWTETEMILKGRTTTYKEPTVAVSSFGGNTVSQHYDLIIADDLVNRDTINTTDQAEKVITYYKDLLDLLEPSGKILVVGTRWADYDLYAWLQDEENDGKDPKIKDVIVRKVIENDKPIWPEKFTPEYIKELKRQKGPYEFSAQYMNEVIDDETATFKKSWLHFFEDDDVPHNINFFVGVDFALSESVKADYTAISVVAVDENENWYVVDYIRDRIGPDQIIQTMMDVMVKWNPKVMAVEKHKEWLAIRSNYYKRCLQEGVPIRIKEVPATTNKEVRIRGALVPKMAGGRLKLKSLQKELINEFLRFPRARHDDLVDSLTMLNGLAFPPPKSE